MHLTGIYVFHRSALQRKGQTTDFLSTGSPQDYVTSGEALIRPCGYQEESGEITFTGIHPP